ncbi:outer membrane protein transport protein [Flavobacterium sp. Fl-318]|jgi:long-subunit fatty acid transport protein|uniref:Outer membrane protein transport protein n=1 Tax=Flavobacterium cupriresistens TaxID=2893885 RepID=A0ABU4RE71_9FLAO|nr:MULTISPECIES: outer membrane protein transport protein [unclassified Flavobacterium]MDX6190883.1 outer membrane protein transport protein [Flavobacterium sp. Fl-318]UFH43945.1 outer membrane protein transport protein [Flavobacterium sp. F-323]
MIKKIIISTCLLISFVSFAQQGTSSPYSFYGIGDARFKGTLEYRSMGGVAVEQDSIHLNIENPASYASLGQTTFSVGGTFGTTKIKTDKETSKAQRSTFDYLALGIPMGKFGAAIGLVPLTSVGYRISNDKTTIPDAISSQLEGKGGVNKVFFGLGYKITPKWNIGADVQYNFGKITTTSVEMKTDVQNATRETNTSELSGVNFNIGTMYQTKIDKKLNLYTSLSYTFSGNLNSDNGRITEVDGDPNTFTYPENSVKLKIPGKFTFGAGIGEARKWLVGTTMAFQGDAGSLANYYNTASNVRYEKSSKYAVGGYYIPNYTSFSSYLSRVTYRAGLKYEKVGLIINNESINDVGMTLGAGFPITGTFSNVNFGIEFGKKGTTSSGLVKENYMNFSMSFSFNDRWFVKSRFN